MLLHQWHVPRRESRRRLLHHTGWIARRVSMRRRLGDSLGILAVFLAAAGMVRAQGAKENAGAEFKGSIRPLFTKYCFSCHNSTKAKASLNLESLAGAEVLSKLAVWKKVAD